MKKILKSKLGYVCIETLIIAGLFISLGGLSIQSFIDSSNGITVTSVNQIEDVQANWDTLTPPSVQ